MPESFNIGIGRAAATRFIYNEASLEADRNNLVEASRQ